VSLLTSQAAAQEDERRRIAQELHDSTVQHLVAASLTLMRLRTQSPEGEEKLWSDVDASLQEAMKELRTFGYLMHPPALRARRLRSTLRAYVDGVASRSNLRIGVRSNPKVDKLPLPLQRSLFRIVQETLANVYRHASASHVSIQLRWIGDRLHLVITDDGRGLEGRSDHKGRPGRLGTGMRGIKARLDAFGGDLRITGRRPNGTRLLATIPVCHTARKAWANGARRPGLTLKRHDIAR
jgi:two-component system NarL family sensor kinase